MLGGCLADGKENKAEHRHQSACQKSCHWIGGVCENLFLMRCRGMEGASRESLIVSRVDGSLVGFSSLSEEASLQLQTTVRRASAQYSCIDCEFCLIKQLRLTIAGGLRQNALNLQKRDPRSALVITANFLLTRVWLGCLSRLELCSGVLFNCLHLEPQCRLAGSLVSLREADTSIDYGQVFSCLQSESCFPYIEVSQSILSLESNS